MQAIIDEIWNRVAGGLDWLKQVIFGEFYENRDISAVIADMLLSFAPGVIIVTSARDLTAVIVRLAKHPEKREQLEEWMLLIACAVPLVLPVLAAAAGAAAAGVGAVIGGIVGSEAGAALRAVCLLLIKKGMPLVEIVGSLRRFIKGDILKVLRDIRFVHYGQALVQYIGKFIGKLIKVIEKLRTELQNYRAFNWVADVLKKLEDLELAFYGLQTSAIQAIPKALAELDVRLQHALAEALPHEPRLAQAGVHAPTVTQMKIEPQRVPGLPGNPLGRPEGTQPLPGHPQRAQPEPNVHPENPREPKLKTMKETKPPCFKGDRLPAGKIEGMDSQLAAQQAGLNNMTVQEYLDGRKAFEDRRLATGNGRDSGKPATEARIAHREKLTEEFLEQNQKAGMSLPDAERDAMSRAAEQMGTLAALHNPDMVAAGPNVIAGFGDRMANSTIGGQWKSPIKGKATEPTRIGAMDAAANAVPIAERASTKMNVRLERCK